MTGLTTHTPADDPALSAGTSSRRSSWARVCLNCDEPLTGRFCSRCGQRAVPPHPTVAVVGLWIVTYVVMAQRRVYGGSWTASVLKTLGIGIIYMALWGCASIAVTLWVSRT